MARLTHILALQLSPAAEALVVDMELEALLLDLHLLEVELGEQGGGVLLLQVKPALLLDVELALLVAQWVGAVLRLDVELALLVNQEV